MGRRADHLPTNREWAGLLAIQSSNAGRGPLHLTRHVPKRMAGPERSQQMPGLTDGVAALRRKLPDGRRRM